MGLGSQRSKLLLKLHFRTVLSPVDSQAACCDTLTLHTRCVRKESCISRKFYRCRCHFVSVDSRIIRRTESLCALTSKYRHQNVEEEKIKNKKYIVQNSESTHANNAIGIKHRYQCMTRRTFLFILRPVFSRCELSARSAAAAAGYSPQHKRHALLARSVQAPRWLPQERVSGNLYLWRRRACSKAPRAQRAQRADFATGQCPLRVPSKRLLLPRMHVPRRASRCHETAAFA